MKLRPYAPGDEARLADLWFDSGVSIGLAHPVVTKANSSEDRLVYVFRR